MDEQAAGRRRALGQRLRHRARQTSVTRRALARPTRLGQLQPLRAVAAGRQGLEQLVVGRLGSEAGSMSPSPRVDLAVVRLAHGQLATPGLS
jgi:hypothetical protein